MAMRKTQWHNADVEMKPFPHNLATDDPQSLRQQADRALALLAAIVDSSDDAIISKTLDGTITSWNKSAERLFGYSAQEALGQAITLVIPAERRAEEVEIIRRLRQGEKIDHFETVRVAKDGTLLDISLTISPVKDAQGQIVGASKVAREIGRRKKAEQETEELHRRLERQARIFDTTLSSITDFVYVLDRQGRFVYVNQALLDLWGLKLEQAIGKNFFELKYPDELASRLHSQVQQVIDTRQVVKDETPYTSPTGSGGYYEYIFSPVFDAAGNVEVVAGSTREITARKKSEEDLRNAKARLEATLIANEIATWTFDPKANKVYADEKLARMFSVSPAEAEGGAIENYLRAIHAEDRPRVQTVIERVLLGHADHYEADYRLVQPDGSVRWVAARGKIQRDEKGIPTQFPGVVIDITERKRAEEMLRESEERFRELAGDLDSQVRERTRELTEQAKHVRDLSQRLLQAQDDERRSIARDLHDSSGQLVVVLGINLQLIARRVARDPIIDKAIEESEALVQQLTRELRTVSYLLHPPLLDESGLESALNLYIEGLSERSALRIQLEIEENFGRLPAGMELAVFRIVQECLTNIHRHSGSSTAAIRLARNGDTVELDVEDNGNGMSEERLSGIKKRSGVGIAGMRERIQRFAGTLDIQSGGSGTRVAVRLPATADWEER
jgi:PAS domain S-box-containing protein